MKILFVAGGSPATVFALAPLATAARNAGHQVFMASNDAMMPVVAGAGLPAVAVTPHPISHFITTDRNGIPLTIPQDPVRQALFTGRWFARMAAASMATLHRLSATWRPDVVVGGTMCYAAPLLATRLGVPYVRQAWDAIEADQIHPGADQELRPELAELGLDKLPEPDLFIDICPPSLRPDKATAAQPMRFVPANRQAELKPWMYTKGDRPRVCVTSGSRVVPGPSYDQNYKFLRTLVETIGELDVEMVVAAPEEVAADLRAELAGVLAGWIPLDVVAPTCDLLVHHAGGVTSLTALNAGVPQVLVPKGAVLVPPAERIARFGAARTIGPDQDDPETIAAACAAVLADPSYRDRAMALSAEIATMPPPAELVGLLETLQRGRTP